MLSAMCRRANLVVLAWGPVDAESVAEHLDERKPDVEAALKNAATYGWIDAVGSPEDHFDANEPPHDATVSNAWRAYKWVVSGDGPAVAMTREVEDGLSVSNDVARNAMYTLERANLLTRREVVLPGQEGAPVEWFPPWADPPHALDRGVTPA